jgi:hypothetical protein
MNERRLIAQYGFLLTGPLATAWDIPDKIPVPGKPDQCGVRKGAKWTVGDSAEEQKMIRDLGRKLLGDGNDPEVVERIEGELAAEATQAEFIREMDADRHRVYKLAQKAATKLQTMAGDYAKAQEAAGRSLEEAAEYFMRLDLPKVTTRTRARIKEAVMMYTTDKEASLRTVAEKFKVSRQRVSQWFWTFTSATGIPVVRHRRHESVRTRTERDYREQLPAKKTSPR